MKLYDKKLSSIDELKREQLRLQYERKHQDREPLFPVKEVNQSDNGAGKNFFGFVMDMLGAESGLQRALTLSKPLLKILTKRSKQPLKKLAIEVGSGYLKWKAIEMVLNGAKLFIKSQKKKHEQKERMKMH